MWMDLGGVAVVPVVEIERLLIEPQEFFPEARSFDGPYWREPWIDVETQRLVYVMRAFLVVTGRHVILVDGCIGAEKPRQRREFDHLDRSWFRGLAAMNVAPTDVDAVLFTHLHVDHVGWATWRTPAGWEPVFHRARHLVTSAELAHWRSDAGRMAMLRTGDYLEDSVEPVARSGLLDEVAPDAVLSAEVRLQPAAGHTPGSVAVRVRGTRSELVIAGDVMHHPLQLTDPQLSTRYCVDPRMAAQTRQHLLSEASRTGAALVASHFAGDPAFRVQAEGAEYVMTGAHDMLRGDHFDLVSWRKNQLAERNTAKRSNP